MLDPLPRIRNLGATMCSLCIQAMSLSHIHIFNTLVPLSS